MSESIENKILTKLKEKKKVQYSLQKTSCLSGMQRLLVKLLKD